MCRIAGILDQSRAVDELEVIVRDMCDALQHGGPDDEGLWTGYAEHLVFGHRRLSLLDLSSAGHQPMTYRDGELVITYNGEVYNFPEIKEELKSLGYSFHTGTDTEVILAAYKAWGKRSFARFNGMFAFALWDEKNKLIYLVRDASGIKPLYYSLQDGFLAFASEVRAFRQLPRCREEQPTWHAYLMAYGHLPEPITTLKKVKPLAKGTFLQYNVLTQQCKTECFAYYSHIENYSDKTMVLDKIKSTLRESVRRHLIADAPIGVFLSGGIDSSIITILAHEVSPENLNTLSIFFTNGLYSEKRYQNLVLKQLQCNHFEHLLKESEFHSYLPKVISAMDLPSSDGINTWVISKLAKENGLKAVLSGVGGDELFGGYPSFQRMKTVSTLQSLPNSFLKTGQFSGSKKLRRLVYLTLPGAKGKYLFLRGQFIPSEIAAHLDMSEKQVWELLEDLPQVPDINHMSKKNQASWIEMNLYMQNQLLRDSDIMSMAHGIEIRVPFLDKEFIKLSLQICSSVKYEGQRAKQLLIDAFRDKLPERVWNRQKMGFAFPFKEWFTNDQYLKEKMLSDGKTAEHNYKLFLKGQRHWSQLLTLLLTKNKKIEPSRSLSYA